MPSFLNKVFGYKRHDDKETARPSREASDSTLLDGKYEAIPPILSPSASTFAEAQPAKDSDRDGGFSLFKPKNRGLSQKSAHKQPANVPHLKLQLPGPKENTDPRSLGVVFEADPDSQIVLDDAVIAAKRLNPLEALILVRACAQAIAERGLETLGVMHPHWFSASPDVQRKLISLFIRSLTQSRVTTLSPTPTSPTSTFENELHYTRSPHDVAAVLRWGLRHLSLENGHFGRDSAEWGWYNTFFQAERNASYPLKAFSELLVPQLPASHVELLTATLNVISSLASHAEANGISGSKLSKCLGLWLLAATRAEQSDDWHRFYARWERGGRILEHLFLARLREESVELRLPTRLQELIAYYPYDKGSPAMDDDLLSRPRFSTRQYDALLVRVETLLAHTSEQPKQHPIQLLLEAFQIPVDNPSDNEHIALWNTLKTTALGEATSSDATGLQFTRIFIDETIHLLSLIPADSSLPTSPTLLSSPVTQVVSRKTSSLGKAVERATPKSHANEDSTPISPTSPSSIMVTDWAQFTMSGFSDSSNAQPLSLLSQDDDIEVTQPRISRKSSRQRGKSRTRRRRSEDHEPLDASPSSQPDLESTIIDTKLASVHVVQIDEAFIDFWSGAIIDPISANWPSFVVCGLKQNSSTQQTIRWLVVEQVYSRQEPQSSRVPSPDGRRGRSPRPSFKSDVSGFRINSVFASARKRFSVFSKSATDLDPKKSSGKTPVVGELGEILVEEESTVPSAPTAQAGLHDGQNATVRTTATDGATAHVADELKADEISTASIAGVPSTPIPKEKSEPVQAAAKAPSIELTPQPGGAYNGSSSVVPRPSAKVSEETISVQQDPPRTPDVVDSENGSATPVTKVTPLASDMSNSQSSQGAYDPTVAASGPASSNVNLIAEDVQIQVQQDITDEVKNRPVECVAQTVDHEERLRAESTGEPSSVVQLNPREDTEVVAMSPIPEPVALVAGAPIALSVIAAAVVDKAPELTVEESHATKQQSQIASVDPVAAFTVPHKIDDLSPEPATKVVTPETGAQLELHAVASVGNVVEEAKGVTELVEIPTPAPELVVLVEETPGPEVSVDDCKRTRAALSAAEREASHDASPQLEVIDDAAAQPVAAELHATSEAQVLFVTHSEEAPVARDVVVFGTSTEAIAVETEHVVDQVPEPAAEEEPLAQDTVILAAESSLVEGLPEVDVSARDVSVSQAIDVAPAEVEAQAAPDSNVHEDHATETRDVGTPTPVVERAALADETPGAVVDADPYELVEATPAINPELLVEAKTQDPIVGAIVETIPHQEAQGSSETEVPTQVQYILAAEALPTGSNSEVTTTALATVDEAVAVKADAESTLDLLVEDAEPHIPTPESAFIEDTLKVVSEASEPAPDFNLVEETTPEPVAQETQAPVWDAAPIASEPVAITPIVTIQSTIVQDAGQAPTEIDPPSNAPTPQFVDDPANTPVVVVAVPPPEEITVVEIETQVEPEPTVDTVDELVIKDAESAPLATRADVPVEEVPVVVDVGEPEPSVAEPAPVEEVLVVVSTGEPAPVEEVLVVDDSEPGPSLAEPAPVEVLVMGTSEPTPVDEVLENLIVDDSEPGLSVTEPALVEEVVVVVGTSKPVPVEEVLIVDDSEPGPSVAEPALTEEVLVVGISEPVPFEEVLIVDDSEPGPSIAEPALVEEVLIVDDNDPELVAQPAPVEEVVVVLAANEPEPDVDELASVEVSAPAPIVEDVSVPAEAEESIPAIVEVPHQVVSSPPEAIPVVESSETITPVEQPGTSEVDVSTHESTPEQVAFVEPDP